MAKLSKHVKAVGGDDDADYELTLLRCQTCSIIKTMWIALLQMFIPPLVIIIISNTITIILLEAKQVEFQFKQVEFQFKVAL